MKNLTTVIITIVAGLALMLGIGAVWHIKIAEKYIEAGYTKTTLPGKMGVYWVVPTEAAK